ncbi:MAG TPA: hypothetical protein EYO59_13095 [Chromatiaceae bacterium]|nr:hypothetical protein [Chromatiaceae bacterium]HIB85491.1 hypothetical protein [Chromatiaceae bacterium]
MSMRNGIVLGVAGIAISMGSGCATVTGSSGQSVAVHTIEKNGNAINDANCTLTNDKGAWHVKTPGSTSVHKSNNEINVSCRKAGHQPGTALVDSATGGAVFGNILIGGGVGWFIDHTSGSAYNYPSIIEIIMGEHLTLKPQKPTTANAAKDDDG